MTARKKTPPPTDPESLRKEVIARYEAGDRVEDICRETGMPKATFYWVLNRYNVPKRNPMSSSEERLNVTDMLDRLMAQQEEIAALRSEVAKQRAVIEYLEAFTAAVRPNRPPARPRSIAS